MRILVTGGTGRLGRQFRKSFSDLEQHQLHILRNPGSGDSPFGGEPVDVTDVDAVYRTVSRFKPDAVVHLASLAGEACEADPARAVAVNVDAVRTVAEAARDAGARRIVFASSSAVYGDQYTSPVRESGTVQPTSIYARTKLDAERVLAEVVGAGGDIRAVTLRIFNVYGEEFESSLVWKLLHSSPANPVRLKDMDVFVRDYLSVDSVVDALRSSLTSDFEEPASVFNIGSGLPTTNRQLVERLSKIKEVFYTVVGGESSYSCADITAARRLLGFSPKTLF